MLAYIVLAVLAVTTLSATFPVEGRQVPISVIPVALLAMFALRTWLHHKRESLEKTGDRQ